MNRVLSVYEVFTPSVPAKEAFVERHSINERLVDAIRTPGKQIVIYGHSGSGKSTLIERKLFETYENHISVSCVKGMTFDAVLLDAFDQLGPFYNAGASTQTSSGITAQISSLWAQVSAAKTSLSQTSSQRMLPPQLTVQNLARLVGASGGCWVLEDFHKLEAEEKEKLAQAMKMFMDAAKAYPSIKAVAVGAVGTAREVVAYDSEMENRVAEIEVPLMTAEEISEIVETGAIKLGVRFESSVSEMVVKFSNGIPAICHQLCLAAARSAGVETSSDSGKVVSKSDLERSIAEFVNAASDSTRDRFDRAVRRGRIRKYDNYYLALRALCEFDLVGATAGDLVAKLGEIEPKYPANNIARYLDSLMSAGRGGVLRKDDASGRYFFADPFIRSYAQAYFRAKSGAVDSASEVDSGPVSVSSSDFLKEVKNYLIMIEYKTKAGRGS